MQCQNVILINHNTYITANLDNPTIPRIENKKWNYLVMLILTEPQFRTIRNDTNHGWQPSVLETWRLVHDTYIKLVLRKHKRPKNDVHEMVQARSNECIMSTVYRRNVDCCSWVQEHAFYMNDICMRSLSISKRTRTLQKEHLFLFLLPVL